MKSVDSSANAGAFLIIVLTLGCVFSTRAQRVRTEGPQLAPGIHRIQGATQCDCPDAKALRNSAAGVTPDGSPAHPLPCDQSLSASGGAAEDVKYWKMPASHGAFTLSYDLYSIPDTLDIYYEGNLIFTTFGPVSGADTVTVQFGPGKSSSVVVVVNEGDNVDSGTAWTYSITCKPVNDLIVKNLLEDQEIQKDEKVYIRGTSPPQMPELQSMLGNSLAFPDTVAWSFQCENPHTKRKSPDKKKDERKFNTVLISSTPWNINIDGLDFFGGNASVSVAIPQIGLRSLNFKILGENPATSDVLDFVNTQANVPWYVKYILQVEGTLAQFNPIGGANAELPVWGPPDGWGIMQIDSKRGHPITTKELWNWQANVQSGVLIIQKNRVEAQSYFTAVERTYPRPIYEDPPTQQLFSDVTLSVDPLDAAAIQLYNGASVKAKLKDRFGNMNTFRSCWVFNPKAGSGTRWKFVDNSQNYVHRVLLEAQNHP